MTNKTVTFHDDPPNTADTNKYKDALNRAKAAQKDKPGDLQNTPRFDQTSSWKDGTAESSDFLSPETKRGLEQLAIAAKRDAEMQKPTEPVVQKPAATPVTNVEDSPLEDVTVTTEDAKLKAAIESRITPIDVGEYLMSGEARQTIPIIVGKLEVAFRTITDIEESYIDTTIGKEPNNITNRQFVRKMNELALALHIYSVNGNKWPTTTNPDGSINTEAIELRLKNIHKLSSPIFALISQNMAWFLDRISKELTISALGNG